MAGGLGRKGQVDEAGEKTETAFSRGLHVQNIRERDSGSTVINGVRVEAR